MAYCFNASLSVPDIDPSIGIDDTIPLENVGENGFFPTYTKIAATEQLFANLASKAKLDANVMKSVLQVVYNGYRNGDNTRIQEIRDAFAKSTRDDLKTISDAELYAATQKAIWYYTDNTEKQATNPKDLAVDAIEKEATMDEKAWYVYRFLLGDTNVAGSPLNGLTLNNYDENMILDLYRPTRVSTTGSEYPNLLSTNFVKPVSNEYKSSTVTIKKLQRIQTAN
ncbi:Cys-Gln thioester bond-forming surface protein [Streptococcus sp. X13SY08]|uniref:Cys-Gln thioester bond-forming surface protein n=1 Tax=Streptococcus sp. X13SY08 TaxID=1676616 RepID=UPI0022A8D376|nr:MULTISPECIES: Cys-Gln thioester bond-forming surface protein [unclassified Streptococcus]